MSDDGRPKVLTDCFAALASRGAAAVSAVTRPPVVITTTWGRESGAEHGSEDEQGEAHSELVQKLSEGERVRWATRVEKSNAQVPGAFAGWLRIAGLHLLPSYTAKGFEYSLAKPSEKLVHAPEPVATLCGECHSIWLGLRSGIPRAE